MLVFELPLQEFCRAQESIGRGRMLVSVEAPRRGQDFGLGATITQRPRRENPVKYLYAWRSDFSQQAMSERSR